MENGDMFPNNALFTGLKAPPLGSIGGSVPKVAGNCVRPAYFHRSVTGFFVKIWCGWDMMASTNKIRVWLRSWSFPRVEVDPLLQIRNDEKNQRGSPVDDVIWCDVIVTCPLLPSSSARSLMDLFFAYKSIVYIDILKVISYNSKNCDLDFRWITMIKYLILGKISPILVFLGFIPMWCIRAPWKIERSKAEHVSPTMPDWNPSAGRLGHGVWTIENWSPKMRFMRVNPRRNQS